ncbi:MAG: serine/threonine-protein kinase [Janthinobacterium lividum]
MPPEAFDSALGASYVLDERIGRGATGEVWRGTDRRSGDTIAAKILHREHLEDSTLVERFVRERSILVGLRHPNVVAVRDLVVEGERLAIVMEFVGGGSLRDALRERGPLRPAVAFRIAAAVLDGLAAAHDRRVLHRDLKPDNVLLASAWQYLGPGAVKLSDFGIAEIVADETQSSSGLIGTPEYMAPEQLVTGAGDLPADVYGAGILLYELLGGRTPFAGAGTGYAVAHRHVTSEPPPLPVPEPVWNAIAGMLAKDPARRPTARVAAAQLRRLAPSVSDLDALPAQGEPDDFRSAGGPATELRGITPPTAADQAGVQDSTAPAGPDADAEPLPELGTPSSATMLRAMPVLPPATTPRTSSTAAPSSGWRLRDRRTVALIVAGALLIAFGIFWVVRSAGSPGPAAPQAAAPIQAQQQSQARPSGLGISRAATWDPSSSTASLTITYSAQAAPLQGPFLEVLPGLGDAAAQCPAVQWQQGAARPNVRSVTGIDTACAWSVETETVPAQGSVTATATVPLALGGSDPTAALQDWLRSAGEATDAATSDAGLTSTAYPAQRLTSISVKGPTRTVSGATLNISLLPVWPNGPDQLNPLYKSPSTGKPSEALVAIAGGTSGVRFTDGCSGALDVSKDGLVVQAQSVAQDCQIGVRVGNFTNLASDPFEITTRGS